MPTLVRRLLTERGDWHNLLLDDNPFRVGQVNKLVKQDFREWKRKLGASLKRPSVGGVLLILDGDVGKVEGNEFCAATVARSLVERSDGGWGGGKVLCRGSFRKTRIRDMADCGGFFLGGPTFA